MRCSPLPQASTPAIDHHSKIDELASRKYKILSKLESQVKQSKKKEQNRLLKEILARSKPKPPMLSESLKTVKRLSVLDKLNGATISTRPINVDLKPQLKKPE